MSWVAVSVVGGKVIDGALSGGGGGGGGLLGGGGASAAAPAGPIESGPATSGAFVFGAQTQNKSQGVPAWALLSGVGVILLGFVAWLFLGNRNRNR